MLFGGETAESYYEEGLTASIKGDHEQALDYFRTALKLDPALASAHHQIGKCMIRLGRFEEAKEALIPALKLLGHRPSILADLAQANFLQGDTWVARTIYSEILQLDGNDTRGVLGLALCAFADEQWVTTMNLIQHAMTLGRLHFDAHFLIARAADKSGADETAAFHYRQALEQMDHSLDITEEQVSGYYLRGMVHAAMGSLNDALRDMERALQFAVADKYYFAYSHCFTLIDILVQKGWVLQALNRYTEAKETGTQILALDPENETGKILVALP
ncbi:MAG: tetratricopeptide repeat protein [Candidatus Hydrogenedens sp.]|jgi:Flp pilus assembly protein TadD|nr:tetratricopeptide repeat protein [Candidatus Hydrogenedens sp.]